MDKANRKVTFEEEADLYEKEALAEIKKQHFDGTEEMGEPYSTLQMGRRVVYRARQEIANRVEVVHARWEDGVCSNCKEEALSTSWDEPIYDYDWEENLRYSHTETHTEYHLTDYCPNCGAKMDGGNEDGL